MQTGTMPRVKGLPIGETLARLDTLVTMMQEVVAEIEELREIVLSSFDTPGGNGGDGDQGAEQAVSDNELNQTVDISSGNSSVVEPPDSGSEVVGAASLSRFEVRSPLPRATGGQGRISRGHISGGGVTEVATPHTAWAEDWRRRHGRGRGRGRRE